MNLSDILNTLGVVEDEQRETGWRGPCLVHEAGRPDAKPSMIVDYNEGTRRVLIRCQSRGCEYGQILVAAGLAPRDLVNPTAVGHAARSIRTGVAKAPAGTDTRGKAGATFYRAARDLARHLVDEPDGDIAGVLRDRYGIDPAKVTADYADALGVGLGRLLMDRDRPLPRDDERLTVVARDGQGMVAWIQSRDHAADDGPKWVTASNPSEGRWDACGWIGSRTHEGAPVIITEGASDALVVAALDRYDVVGIRGASLGARITEVSADLVGRDVVLAIDNDEAGRALTVKLLHLLSPLVQSIAYVKLPAGTDVRDMFAADPDTFAWRFAEAVEGARTYEPEVTFDYEAFIKDAGTSDAGCAQAVLAYAKARGLDIAYTPGMGWLVYNGAAWEIDAEAVIWQLGFRLGRHVMRTLPDPDAAEKAARPYLNTTPIKGWLAALQATEGVRVPASAWDAHPELLAVGNGVVHIPSGELRPMRPDYRITKRLAVNYNPEATAPRWESFLGEVLVDDTGQTSRSMITSMRQLVGFGVTGYAGGDGEQCFGVLVGNGANGKSVFLSVLAEVFDAIHVRTSSTTFEKQAAGKIRADLARIRAARLVTASESNQGAKFDEGLIKTVTGGDLIEAEEKFKAPFQFRPSFLLLLATNHAPEFRGRDDGLWRRVKRINFRRKFAEHEQDPALATRLIHEEAEGILAWALQGAREWLANGNKIQWSPEIEAATSAYRADADPDAEFIETNLVYTGNPKDIVLLASIYERAVEWWEADGTPKEHRPGRTKFGRRLEQGQLGPRVSGGGATGRVNRPVRWRGWRLRSVGEVARLYAEARAETPEAALELEAKLAHMPEVDEFARKYADRYPGENAMPLFEHEQ